MKLGEFVWKRLHEAGLRHVFGVPGDFNLGILNFLLKSDIEFIGTCNELNAAYAADAYARVKGLGSLVTTYAVGELSAINGVAGAFAESVPIIHVVGSPATYYANKQTLLHHTMGDYGIPSAMTRPIVVAQCILSDPNTFARNIDHVISRVLMEKKPGYISIPADMVTATVVDLPQSPFKPLPLPVSDKDVLKEAIEEICEKLTAAKRPLLLPGVELVRRGLENEFAKLVEKSGIPYATMLLSKSILDEDHDLFIGLYSGGRSRPEVIQRVLEADCILNLGEKMTDFNTGGFTAHLTPENSIYIGWNVIRVKRHEYRNVYIHDALAELLKYLPHKESANANIKRARDYCRHCPIESIRSDEKVTMAHVFSRFADVLKPGALVMAETGASLFSAAETKLPKGATFLSQTFYGSIGYSIGACLGASIAIRGSDKRVYLFVGDGSLQVTVQDISTMIRHKCNPIIVCINNDGYTIERTICDNTYNDIQMWKYADLPPIFGGLPGYKVTTKHEFEDAIEKCEANKQHLGFMEVVLERMDCNDLLIAAGALMRKNNSLEIG